MPYQSIGDFPVNVMMNQFDLSNWYNNDESDFYDSIDLIKDYYDDKLIGALSQTQFAIFVS
jgi:hypothetical protein